MNIPMPSPEEKNKAVQQILRTTYQKTWYQNLKDTFSLVGFRNLWVGLEWCVLLPLISALLYLTAVLPDTIEKWEETPMELFFVAPFFYGSLLSLTLWKEWQDDVYTLKEVCVFSTSRLHALRCLLLGGISMLLQTVSLVFVVMYGGTVEISALLFSLSLLLCYGGMSFYTLRKTTTPTAHSLTFALWILGCLLGNKLFSLESNFEQMYSHFGIGVLFFFLVPSGLFLATQLKKYILQGEYSCYPYKT